MNEAILHKIPTIDKMIQLYDVYKPDIKITEKMTLTAQTKIHNFINAVLDTPPMKLTMEFLIQKRLSVVPSNYSLNLCSEIFRELV